MAIDDNTSYELTGYQVKDIAQKIRAKADSSSLASVATSGLYSDLTGAPTIPTVYNGTLTIQHNGTTKGTFTANQSTASTVNIETIYADDYISTSPIPTTVTTAMIEDGAVTAAKTAFGGNYSTTEVNTGFTWIDGKPIYKKTIHGTFSSIPSSGLSWNHNISGLSYVVKIETAFKLGWETAWGNDGFLARAGMAVRVNSTKVYIDTNSSNSYNGAVDVTLWYTKTA